MDKKENISFVAENTLGKLAKWLRMLGFDTVYEIEPLAKRHYEPGRIRLTRTRKALKKYPPHRVIFIISDRYTEQIRQVIKTLGLTLSDIDPFTRCIRCNTSIQSMDKPPLFGHVPDYVWETHDTFRSCPKCNRIYWPGTHTQQSLERIRKLFEG